jgi:hypothetical protein
MIKSLLFIVLFAMTSWMNAQETYPNLVKGDIVILGNPKGSDYHYIDFPRKNSIIKRGAIANFNALIGKKLVVEHIETNKTGTVVASLKRKDGQKFFRFFPTVKANLNGALNSGEIKLF